MLALELLSTLSLSLFEATIKERERSEEKKSSAIISVVYMMNGMQQVDMKLFSHKNKKFDDPDIYVHSNSSENSLFFFFPRLVIGHKNILSVFLVIQCVGK